MQSGIADHMQKNGGKATNSFGIAEYNFEN